MPKEAENRMRSLVLLIGCAAIACCTQLPDIAEPVQTGAEDPGYPALVNLSTLELTADAADARAQGLEQTVAARVSRLKARAAALRGVEFD